MSASEILVVDYDQENSRILSKILSEAGHKVYPTNDSVEAVGLLNSKYFDLVLTEINMPEMNGIDLLRMVKAKWKKNPIPVVFIAERADVKTTFTAISEGARDLIVKPLDPKTIIDAVDYVLENRSLTSKKEAEAHLQQKIRQPEKQLTKNIADIKMLDDIAKELAVAKSITDICWTVLNMVQQLMEANRIALSTKNVGEQCGAFTCTYGDELGVIEELIPLDQKIQDWVVQHKSELLIGDLNKDYKYAGLNPEDQEPGSILAVPFIIKEKVIGLIVLFKDTPNYFGKEVVHFINVLARLTAAAIENMSLSQTNQQYINGTIRSLITTLEAKNDWTLGHASRVGRYALMMAKALKLNKREIKQLEYLALLHDIGMIGVRDNILERKGQLTKDEWSQLHRHTEIGANIIQTVAFITDGDAVIRHHHEWFNGQGYPEGLRGEAIPLFSRIIAIAEAFDSMTGNTCYRETVSVDEAVKELKKYSGTQFDPDLVNLFLRVLQTE